MFHCLDSHCAPGSSRPNEDAWGAGEGFAFVLDGATDLTGDGAGAARLFCQGVARQLMELLPQRGRSLRQCLAQAAAETAAAGGCAGASASALLVRALPQETGVEILSLGDCTLVFEDAAGTQVLWDDCVARLDGAVVARMEDLSREGGISVAAAREHPEIGALLRANRALRNTPEGYWILDPSLAGVAHAQSHTCTLAPGGRLLLMTDGFFAALEMGLFPDAAALLAGCTQRGLDGVAQDLRHAQQQDRTLARHPRLKIADDATAVLLG